MLADVANVPSATVCCAVLQAQPLGGGRIAAGGGAAAGSPSLASITAALRALPLVPLVGGRVAAAADALLPPAAAALAAEDPRDSDGDGDGTCDVSGEASRTGVDGNNGAAATVQNASGVGLKGRSGQSGTKARRGTGADAADATAGVLGEGYCYGFEERLPLVDLAGRTLSMARGTKGLVPRRCCVHATL